METVTVYKYRTPYNTALDDEPLARRMATREFIERVNGTVIEETALEVDVSTVDAEGKTELDFDDEKPIRYHLTHNYVLDRDDRVFIDRLEPGTINWFRFTEVLPGQRHPVELESLLRDIADREGGEAWRAMTDRGELLRVFSVCDSTFLPAG